MKPAAWVVIWTRNAFHSAESDKAHLFFYRVAVLFLLALDLASGIVLNWVDLEP
jgi:hypothetical protein